MNFDDLEAFRAAIITGLTEDEKLDERFLAEVDGLTREEDFFYAKSLGRLISLEVSEEEAFGHWKKIMTQRQAMEKALGRGIALKAVALDYFHTLNETSLRPLGIDLGVFRLKERLAMVDELTGTFNRRYFDLAFTRELKRAQRFNKMVTLLLFSLEDINFFNDVRDPLLEIKTLKKIIRMIESMMRADDTLCRYADDRYCCILPEANADGAAAFAERIRRKLKEVVKPGPGLKNLFATGIATYPQDADDRTALLQTVEGRLIRSRDTGDGEAATGDRQPRKQKRFVMTWKVTFDALEGELPGGIEKNECHTQDVSLGGLSFETNREMEQGTKLLLVLKPAILSDEFIKVIGIVRTVKKLNVFKYQYGVEFHDLKEEQIKKIKSILPLHEVRMH